MHFRTRWLDSSRSIRDWRRFTIGWRHGPGLPRICHLRGVYRSTNKGSSDITRSWTARWRLIEGIILPLNPTSVGAVRSLRNESQYELFSRRYDGSAAFLTSSHAFFVGGIVDDPFGPEVE